MLIARHGGEAHVVRPDRVYRTGVLTPIVGFQPQQDVMANAAAFTQGPYYFQQGSVVGASDASPGVAGPRIQFLGARGYGAAPGFGILQQLWLRFKAWRASKNAAKVLATTGVQGLFGLTPYGPANWAGNQVMPGNDSRVGMLVAIAQARQPTVFAQNNTDVIMQRWNYLRR